MLLDISPDVTFHISKIHPLRDAAFDADRRASLKSLKIVAVSLKKWILVILSITITCRTNIHILIRSPLKMEFLHLLWIFHGYIFNGFKRKMNLKTATCNTTGLP